MKLLRAIFTGLPGAKKIDITFDDVNVFIGPNGAGKSTILNVLKLALDLLSKKTVCGFIGEIEDWLLFNSAELTFSPDPEVISTLAPLILQNISEKLVIKIKCDERSFHIEHLKSDSEVHIIKPPTIEEISELRNIFQTTENRLEELDRQIIAASNSTVAHNLRVEQNRIKVELEAEKNRYTESLQCEIIKPGSLAEDITRGTIDGFLEKIRFPAAILVDSAKAIDEAIPRLINSMCELKAGKRSQNKQFNIAQERLQHLLEHEIDFYEKDGKRFLTVNGVDYRKASSGTRVSLAYFGLTNLLAETDIVIWDEPENGLHPTRRIRVLDLILEDPRQFFIATHALEFAPIYSSKATIFRCDSNFQDNADATILTVAKISGRKEGFLLLEAMGVQPARTLFTANVVLWVEGPTELVFYRHWLKKVLHPLGLEEGFHYTIMHYGGGLISYLDVADEEHRKQAFDALSICRNLVILVDSDLHSAIVTGDVVSHLKPGARRIKEEVDRLNIDRPGSALFCVTEGREIENYLPPRVLLHAASLCWKGFEDHKMKLDPDAFEFGRYDSFEKSLEAFLMDAGVTREVKKDGSTQKIAIGKSLWGAVNKVEIMRSALTMNDLQPEDLQWGFSNQLNLIAEFVKQANSV
jgi:predicted ATP-dependent endonuclease of OLD family